MNEINNKKIVVEFGGSDIDNEKVRLSEFITELASINKALQNIDCIISKSSTPTMYYRITQLRQYSPATVEIQPVPKKEDIDYSLAVTDKFMSSLRSICNAESPPDFDIKTLEAFGEIGNTLKKNMSKINLRGNGFQIELKKDLSESIEKILGKDEIIQGSVSGILEALNIHGPNRRFTIYPIAGAKKIDCQFSNELLEKAISAVNKHIHLRGKVKYKKKATFPFGIIVEEIEIYPSEDKLPTIFELRGIAPNATGKLKSEDFISRIREEYE